MPMIVTAALDNEIGKPVEIIQLQGSEWKSPNPVYIEETAPEGYQCRYLIGNGNGPIRSQAFLIEITGKWKALPEGEFVARCRIIVPKSIDGVGMAETFPGKVWARYA